MCEAKHTIPISIARWGATGAARGWAVAAAGLLSAGLLSGCIGLSDRGPGLLETANDAPPVSAAGEHDDGHDDGHDEHAATGLSAELLYDLLLANIAGQRGHNEVAMASLSRAAYLSRDRRIVARAIGLAARLADHPRVIELSGLLAGARESRHLLMLANARLETGYGDAALTVLIDLARAQPAGSETVLQSIASLLATRPPGERMLPRFRRGIEAWPQSPELKLTAALLATELKQDEAFRELINEALRLRPDWEIAAMLKLTDLTNFDRQRMPTYADGFLGDFPDAKTFRIHYGRLLLGTHQIKKSLAQFEIVLRQDPQSSAALFSSGVGYLEQENWPEALARLSKSLALDPRNDQARLYIAGIKIEQKAFDAAAAVLREVSAPEYYLDVETRLAIVIAKQQGLDAGIRRLEEIDVRNEDQVVRVILAQDLLYREFDRLDRARAVLDAGLAKIPGQPDLLYNRGLLAAQLNLLELHERDMRALIEQQPDNADAYNALGYTLADQTTRLDEAMELITRALEMKPNSPYILDSMGWVNFRIGNNDEAIAYLRRALDAQKNAEIAAHLGEVLWIAGKRRAAREIWEQGKQWSPDDRVLLDTMQRFLNKTSSGAPTTAWLPATVQLPVFRARAPVTGAALCIRPPATCALL